jgi:predicted 3-demethylubiquinone-9 3-methyltransferase (glyoxalase superfamily)
VSNQARQDFRDCIGRWCSVASRLLGWRPDEFWQATPRELANALADPDDAENMAPPSRDLIAQLIERDSNG